MFLVVFMPHTNKTAFVVMAIGLHLIHLDEVHAHTTILGCLVVVVDVLDFPHRVVCFFTYTFE
jgi:hypothetical protein